MRVVFYLVGVPGRVSWVVEHVVVAVVSDDVALARHAEDQSGVLITAKTNICWL